MQITCCFKGWNSWNCYGSGVTSADLRSTADFFVSSGLADVGYEYVITLVFSSFSPVRREITSSKYFTTSLS